MSQDFVTDKGIEVPAVSARKMREIDRIAMEETGPNLFQMMENAGRNLMQFAIEQLGSGWQKANIMVLAGKGGNGGGGISAARHLANHNGRICICLAGSSGLNPVTAYQLEIYKFSNGQEAGIVHLSKQPVDLILDAVLGYSLNNAPEGTAEELIVWANQSNRPIISLDIPSGVNASSGDAPGEYIQTDQTLTLALPKTGLLPDKIGDLFLADIGIPWNVYKKAGLKYHSPFEGEFCVHLNYFK